MVSHQTYCPLEVLMTRGGGTLVYIQNNNNENKKIGSPAAEQNQKRGCRHLKHQCLGYKLRICDDGRPLRCLQSCRCKKGKKSMDGKNGWLSKHSIGKKELSNIYIKKRKNRISKTCFFLIQKLSIWQKSDINRSGDAKQQYQQPQGSVCNKWWVQKTLTFIVMKISEIYFQWKIL